MFGLNKYQYSADKSFTSYLFYSSGPNGTIQKVANFSETDQPNVYNFGFGDYNSTTQTVSDTANSNNGDIDIIMGTLGSIIYDFTNLNPNATVFFLGTNAARTRLYQMNISKHWEKISPLFELFGYKNNAWHPFKKGVNYEAFMGRRRPQTPVL